MKLNSIGYFLFICAVLACVQTGASAEDVPVLEWKRNWGIGPDSDWHGCTRSTALGNQYDMRSSSPKEIAEKYCASVDAYYSCVASATGGTFTPMFSPSNYLSYSKNPGGTSIYHTYNFQCSEGLGSYYQGVQNVEAITNSSTTLSDVSKEPKNRGNPGCGMSEGNPINVANGNKYQREAIYSDASSGLDFSITYNSQTDSNKKQLGTAWRSDYDKVLSADAFNDIGFVGLVRPDGSGYGFKNSSGNLVASDDKTYKLSRILDGQGNLVQWKYEDDFSGEAEFYNSTGTLTTMTDRAGNQKTLTYSTSSTPASIAPKPGLLISVSDQLGRIIKFKYDSASRLSTFINPQGATYLFQYDANQNLSTVTYPDNKVQSYHYENASFKNALTGITDENSSRFATWGYDSTGRANASEHAGSTSKIQLTFNATTPPTTTVTTPATGASRDYTFLTTSPFRKIKLGSRSQPAGSGCAASSSNLTYDVNGNVASRVDFNGNKTTYVYDLTRNVETSRTEGLTTAGAATTSTRTITTSWHSTWRLPLVVSVYTGASASGTPVQRTTYTYDTKGNTTSVVDEDPVRSLSRTTTTTYTYSSAVPGLILQKVVNGPRTDVTDTTNYEYYPHDATCTASTATPIVDPITGVAPANYGCRGQLKKVTNALGHITTYDRYNHHGQLEQMTDPNSLVTQQTYDLRQRLLTRTMSGSGIPTQTTQLTYDNVGQITQLKMPDNSTLNYTYDAAHRLADIQDTLGNKVHYTLDTEGNRTQENTYDLQGNLAKTISRSYDALNRLQTQTGIAQ